MARCVLLLAILSVLVTGLVAPKAEKYIGNAVNPAYPGQCYYKEEDVAIPVGGKYLLKKECEEALCRKDFVLKFETCPFYGDREVIEGKPGLFPDCCPIIKKQI